MLMACFIPHLFHNDGPVSASEYIARNIKDVFNQASIACHHIDIIQSDFDTIISKRCPQKLAIIFSLGKISELLYDNYFRKADLNRNLFIYCTMRRNQIESNLKLTLKCVFFV